MKTCDVLVNGNVDQLFTYAIPGKFAGKIGTGHIVTVPLGSNKITGIVVRIGSKTKMEKLKEILNIKYEIKVLNENSFGVIKKTSDYFLQNIGKFCTKLIPLSGPNYRIEYNKISNEGASKREKEILALIGKRIDRKELLSHTTRPTILRMIAHRLIREIKTLLPCRNDTMKTEYTDFSSLPESNSPIYKMGTVFIQRSPTIYDYINKIILNNLNKGRKTLIIIPQLLSHQFLVDFLKSVYGNKICFYSSALSDKEKNISFHNIIAGNPEIIVGTGDALFLPYENPGSLIFLMPESPHHFHYDSMPFYNTEIVAGIYANEYSVPLYIIGKTPSINLIPSINSGRTRFIESGSSESAFYFLKSKNPYDILTKQIVSEIKSDMERGKRTLVIYNQLGYYPFVKCNNCNTIVSCPACNTPLTFTGKNNLYYCQKCKKYFTIKKCMNCGSNNLNFSGTGIEKLASQLRKEFGSNNIKTISASAPLNIKEISRYNLIITTSFIFRDLYPNKFHTIIIPSIENILNEYVIKSEWHFVRIAEYLKSFLDPGGKMMVQSPIYYDFIPYLTSGKTEKYISYTLNLRKEFSLPPYFHTISIKISGNNSFPDQLYKKLAKYENNSTKVSKSNCTIVIKTKKLSDFIFLKPIQRKREFRIYVDSEEYL
ncbi:MAG: hypothetical protein GWP03_03025 [Proteobacteria bacterium]|nr:hypothetical protein [Pseudomonadota bacterium]